MDPRKRLQVLNSNNPSLRMNVAPQQQLKVVTDRPNNLRIGNNVIRPNPNGRVERAPKRGGINVGSVANTVAKDVGGFLPRLAMNYSQFFGNLGTRAAGGKAETSKDFWNDPVTSRVQKWSGADGTARQIGGDIAQAGLTIAGGGAGKIAAAVGKTAVPRFAAKAAPVAYEAGVGGAFNLASSLSQDELRKDNAAQTFGIGAAFGGAARPVAGVIGRVADKVLPSRKALTSLSKSVAKSTDARSIESSLKVAPEVADYLAGQQDPAHVKTILKQLNIDPRIQLSSTDKKRLQDEGIENVEIGETPYGAEYNNSTIRFSDPSQATPDKIYHELGHHIWRSKLTPDEKALFAGYNGGAKKSAKGRAGYTEDDLISEDFSEMMKLALTGKISSVPSQFRGVLQKYAKVAADAAEESIRFTPAREAATELTKVSRYANDLAAVTKPGSADSLTAILDVLAKTTKKSDVRDILFGQNGMLKDLPLDSNTRNRLVKDLEGDTNAVSVRTKVAQAIESGQKGAPAKVADETTPEIEKAAESVAPVEPAPATAPIEQAAEQVSTKSSGTSDWNDNIEEAFPDMSPEAQALVRDTMNNLKPAQEGYDTAVVARKRETAQRSQAGNAAFEAAGGGQAGFKAEMAAQRGKKTASAYAPTPGHQAAKDEIINDLTNNTNLMDWERRNTYNALQKMWGDIEDKPTTSDIKRIRDYYNTKQEGLGDDVADLVEQAVEKDNMDVVEQLAGAPRTAMTIFDLSALRQLALGLARHPVAASKSYGKGAIHAFSKKKFNESTKAMQEMTDAKGKNYSEFMDSEMNIHFSNAAESAAEEATSSTQLLAKIPVYGKVVEGSNRSMSTTTSEFRFRVAKQWIDANGGVEEVAKNFSKQELTDLGEVLNTISGRGGKKGGFTDQHSKILSKTLFSGKLWASRLNAINPYWYYRLSGPARKEALQNAASFAALTGVVLAAIDQMDGAEVGKDWRSADFGKIKVGNTRYDITGGLMINIRVLGQILTGEKMSSTSGEVKETTAGDTISGLAEGKLNPLLGFAWRIAQSSKDDEGKALTRENEFGEDFNVLKEAGKLAVPLNISGVAETVADTGSVLKGTAMALPSFFGAGVQTYGNTPTKETGKNGEFKGKVTDDMVLDNDGKPMLDEKGRVIKAKFEDDATDLEKQAELKSKQKEAYTKKAKESLSKDDRAIYKMGQADKDSLTEEQQAKYEQIKKYVESYGKKTDIPDGIKSDVAKNFYSKYNTMTKEDQKHWLTEAPEENSKKIAEQLNKERTKGLPEFTASNALAKAYAEFEKDINTHPEYSATDLRHKTKEFQKFALKLNYSESIRDLYQNASKTEADLEYVIKDGKVSQADLDKAIELDNHLYSSGLNSTLTFSKTFRKDYGYGIPAKGGAASGSGSDSGGGGRRGDETPRTHLVKLLPNFKPGTTTQAPSFSGKARTTPKIDAGDLPGVKKNKVNIKL